MSSPLLDLPAKLRNIIYNLYADKYSYRLIHGAPIRRRKPKGQPTTSYLQLARVDR
jgi:hypothetical protein